MKQRFPIIATLLTLAAIGVLCGLGVWQMERLKVKEKMIAKLEAEYALNAAERLLSPADLSQNFEYRRGTVSGRYLFDKQVFVGPRPYDNMPGFHVLTPLQLSDGSVLLVNRGWVSQHWPQENQESHTDSLVTLTGLARTPPEGNPFTPPNVPDKDQWYRPDPVEIGKAMNLGTVYPYIFYPEKGESVDEYPLSVDERPDIPNNHFLYALFWFSMAGALGVIYILRFFTKKGRA